MDAARYVALVRRWWWLLVIGASFAVAAYLVVDQPGAEPPAIYEASTTLIVSYQSETAEDSAALELELGQGYAKLYKEMINAQPVAVQIIADNGLTVSPALIQSRIQADVVPGTQLLHVTATGSSADEAALLAGGVAQALARVAASQDLPATVSVYDPATASVADAEISLWLMITIAAIAGLFASAAVVFVYDYFKDPVNTGQDAATATGLALLGSIPSWPASKSSYQHMESDGYSQIAERYRMLRTNFDRRTAERAATVVLFAGGLAKAGTSTTAANFAQSLAQTGRQVALIDANLRDPSLHKMFAVPNHIGLTQALSSGLASIDLVLQPTDIDGLMLISAGPSVPNPAELLASNQFSQLLEELATRVDVIVLDSPPALEMADASILAARADATIAVLEAYRTERQQAAATVEALQCNVSCLAGVVLNGELPSLRQWLSGQFRRRRSLSRKHASESEARQAS